MSPSPSHSVMIVFIVLGGLAWHVSDRRNSFFLYLTYSLGMTPKSHPCYHDIRMCSFLWLHITSISTYRLTSIWIVYLLDLVFPWRTLRLVLYLDSSEWCCNGHGSADLSLRFSFYFILMYTQKWDCWQGPSFLNHYSFLSPSEVIQLLLLLLSCFHRVQLCATP